jgi:hypothetical protein
MGTWTYGERKVSIVLEQDCHSASKIRQTQRLDILSIKENSSLGGVIYASHKLKNCTFPGSVRTEDDLSAMRGKTIFV